MTFISQIDEWLIARIGTAAAHWVEDALLVGFAIIAARIVFWL